MYVEIYKPELIWDGIYFEMAFSLTTGSIQGSQVVPDKKHHHSPALLVSHNYVYFVYWDDEWKRKMERLVFHCKHPSYIKTCKKYTYANSSQVARYLFTVFHFVFQMVNLF